MASAYFDTHRGGIEMVAGKLARELQQRGAVVTWLATDATAPSVLQVSETFTPKSIPAWNITERRLGIPFPVPGAAAIAAIWRAVRKADAVLLHDSLYPSNVAVMLAARWYRKPVVLVQHIAAVPYANPLLRGLMQTANLLIARPMLGAADQVVFISQTVAGHFSNVQFKAKPRLIFNGVDTELFRLPNAGFDKARVKASLGLSGGRPLVVFVGRFVEKKGLHIIERIACQRPDVDFALAGWGPIDPRSWRLSNVHVFSDLHAAALVPLYQSGDVFVLPSVGEGLPLVMQEALACGLPVICGSETALADPAAKAFIEGVAIDLSSPDQTAGSFAAAIDRVLAGEAALPDAAMARNAYASNHYSWKVAAMDYLAIMRSLVASQLAAAGGSTQPARQDRA
ncbi:MAG: glycosyltransferase family 4 protein [Hyphomicrobiaceae bacterium]